MIAPIHPPPAPLRRLPLATRVALFATVYYVLALGCKWLSPGDGSFVAYWLPSGLILAVLLHTSGASWPWFLAAGGAANIAFDLTDGQRPAVALGFATASMLEAALSAWLIRRHTGLTFSVERLRDFLTMAMLAGLIGAPIGAALGGWTAARAFDQPFLAAWGTWWGGDLVGVLVLAPLVLTLLAADLPAVVGRLDWGHRLEAVVLLLTTGVLTHLTFASDPRVPSFPYLCFLPLLWAAVRFNGSGVAVLMVVVAVLAVLHTTRGHGPFAAASLSLEQHFLQVQLFLGVASLTAFSLAAVMAERRQGEQSLRISEERHRRLLGMLPDGVLVHTADRVTYCNPAAASILGQRSPEGIIGQPVLALFHPHLHAAFQARIDRMLATDQGISYLEQQILLANGTSLPVGIVAMPFQQDGDRSILVLFRDLTRLHSTEEHFRLLVEGVKDHAIIMIDQVGSVITWNPGAERMTGYTSAEIVGQSYARLYPPEALADGTMECEMRRAAIEGRVSEEGWRVRKDGSRFWSNGTLTALRDPAGRLRGFAKVARDLTELRRSQELLRAVLDNSLDGIIAIDERGLVHSFNAAAERLFGYRADEIVGRNVKILMPEPDRSQHDRYLANYLETGQARVIGIGREVVACRKDGTTFPADLEVTEFQVTERRMFSGIVRDLTDKKRLEAQFRQAQKMEAVGQLAGGVAHDFNNLLTVILGHCEIVQETVPPHDPVRQDIDEILKAGQRAAGLTRQLLAFSRKQVLEPRVIDLNDLVANLERMLGRLIGENIRLVTALAARPARVRVDPGQIEQVIVNLAVNARDAMPGHGRLTLETGRLFLDEELAAAYLECRPGPYVTLAVSDTGSGMSPEVKAHLFEPFFTTKEVGRGTGLGLATVYGILKQSGGHISVYSEVGVGTTFKVLLPASDEGIVPIRPSQQSIIRPGTETILVVEDEPAVREVARVALETNGYRVLLAHNGREAVDVATAHRGTLHLLLSDMVMPEMNGRELAGELRRRFPSLRIVFMSGYTHEAVVHHGVQVGEVFFLQKPFSLSSLINKVREVLDSPS